MIERQIFHNNVQKYHLNKNEDQDMANLLCLTIEIQYCERIDIGSDLNLEDSLRVKKLASLVDQEIANLLRNNYLRQKSFRLSIYNLTVIRMMIRAGEL